MRRVNPRELARLLAVAVPSLGAATIAIGLLQDGLGAAQEIGAGPLPRPPRAAAPH